jgi:hypothetical protein
MKTLKWKDKLKASQWANALGLYLAGVVSLAVVAYGCKLLLSLL